MDESDSDMVPSEEAIRNVRFTVLQPPITILDDFDEKEERSIKRSLDAKEDEFNTKKPKKHHREEDDVFIKKNTTITYEFTQYIPKSYYKNVPEKVPIPTEAIIDEAATKLLHTVFSQYHKKSSRDRLDTKLKKMERRRKT